MLLQSRRQATAFEDTLAHLDEGALQSAVFGLLDERRKRIHHCQIRGEQRRELAGHDRDILRPHAAHGLEQC